MYGRYCWVTMSVAPKYDKRAGTTELQDTRMLLIHHQRTRGSVEGIINCNIMNVDVPMREVGDTMIQNLLMDINCQSNMVQKALIAIDAVSYGKAGITLTFPKKYEDARMITQHPESYLLNLYPVTQKYLPPAAIEQALKMEWDEDQQHPIPLSEILAKESLQDGQNDWTIENLEILDPDSDGKLEGIGNQPKQKFQLEHANPETNSLATFGCGGSTGGDSLTVDD